MNALDCLRRAVMPAAIVVTAIAEAWAVIRPNQQGPADADDTQEERDGFYDNTAPRDV